MNISEWFFHTKEDFKAWRRGEKRCAPKGARGRVYVNKDGPAADPGNQLMAQSDGRATMTMKVTRAGGDVEYHDATNVRIEEI